MCRHLAYLGAPVTLAELLLEQEHGLLQQTWDPQEMRGSGVVNADGFGVGWYDGPGDAVRYRRDVPMWADASFADLAGHIRTSAVLAATRNGTTGMPVIETASAPFHEGRWLLSHNGAVVGWPTSVADLAAGLPVTDLMTLEAPTDSVLLWALARHLLRQGAPVAQVVEEVTLSVAEAAPGSRLNLLLTDGETIAATTWGHSLAVREQSDHVVVSSEPFGPDPERWQPIPEHQLVVASTAGVKTRPLT
jgi:glutamine amidotransferase